MLRKKNRFARFGSWLRASNPLVFSLVMVAVTFLATNVVTAPLEFGWIEDIEFFQSPLELDFSVELVVTAVVIAPLIETLIFQLIPFTILHRFRFFRERRWLLVLLPALIFGSMHYYSVGYMLATGIAGFALMYAYVIRWRRYAYWNVVLFHSIWNALAIIIEHYDKL